MTKTITLETPIQRGDQQITELTIRKPNAGALRGASLTQLLQLDVTELCKVLPRITSPAITDAEAMQLDVADLTAIGSEVVGFLLPKALRPDYLIA